LVELVKIKNEGHIKYMASDFYVASSPIKSFMTTEFKTIIKEAFDRGKVSAQTYTELCPEADFETEVYRRTKEAKRGIEYIMYPQITINNEEKGVDVPGMTPEKKSKDNISSDKKGADKRNYINASDEDLTGAPYSEIGSLPESVRKRLSLKQQRAWMDIFNNALNFYTTKKGLDRKAAEARAFSTAWTKAKKVHK